MQRLKIYKACKRAKNVQGILCTLFSGRASDSVIAGEYLYHYRKGKGFSKTKLNVALRTGSYDLKYIGEATSKDIELLDSMVGMKWSILNNCFRTTDRILHRLCHG